MVRIINGLCRQKIACSDWCNTDSTHYTYETWWNYENFLYKQSNSEGVVRASSSPITNRCLNYSCDRLRRTFSRLALYKCKSSPTYWLWLVNRARIRWTSSICIPVTAGIASGSCLCALFRFVPVPRAWKLPASLR